MSAGGAPGEGAAAAACAVCGRAEPDPRQIARCYGCRRPFHLNPDAGPGRDCGDVWAGSSAEEGFTGLELYCAPCFERRLSEAASALPFPPPAGRAGGAAP